MVNRPGNVSKQERLMFVEPSKQEKLKAMTGPPVTVDESGNLRSNVADVIVKMTTS